MGSRKHSCPTRSDCYRHSIDPTRLSFRVINVVMPSEPIIVGNPLGPGQLFVCNPPGYDFCVREAYGSRPAGNSALSAGRSWALLTLRLVALVASIGGARTPRGSAVSPRSGPQVIITVIVAN